MWTDIPAGPAEELFQGVYPALAGWIGHRVDDDGTAHELASEAFARLLPRWTQVDNPRGYLYTIAANLVRDHWRKTERERRALRRVTSGRPGAGAGSARSAGQGRAGRGCW